VRKLREEESFMRPTTVLLRSALLALAGLLPSLHAAAQPFPSKPIRSIVPSGTGTGSDSLCRIFTEHLAQRLGQAVVTENRPGGNAVIGIDAAVKSPADGYTMLCFGGGSAAPSLHKSLPWDFLKVMDPVVYIYRLGLFLSVSGTLPVSTTQEFIAHAKANPGKLNYYYIAPSQKIAFAYFANRAGIELTEVYYKSGQAHVDLVAGLVHAGMDGPASFRAQLDAGRVKMLFVASNVRSPSYPNVPTSAEVGLGDFQMITGHRLLGARRNAEGRGRAAQPRVQRGHERAEDGRDDPGHRRRRGRRTAGRAAPAGRAGASQLGRRRAHRALRARMTRNRHG
jgi:tripartite-type tricarboxylate transporter receptor subunit TctC